MDSDSSFYILIIFRSKKTGAFLIDYESRKLLSKLSGGKTPGSSLPLYLLFISLITYSTTF